VGKTFFMNFPLPCLITEGCPFGNQPRNTMKRARKNGDSDRDHSEPHMVSPQVSAACMLSSHWSIQKWKVISENFSESWQLGFQVSRLGEGCELAKNGKAGCNNCF
jgi:hypothetical protein